MQLRDKVVLLTGASSGIGAALVKALAARGAKVALVARNQASLAKVFADAQLTEQTGLVIPFDVTCFSEAADVIQRVIDTFGRLDVLLNNAGISQRAYAEETPLEIDQQIMAVNYFATVHLTKLALPYLRQHNKGHIVVISSIAGKFGVPWRSAYCASKHALHGFFTALAMELDQQSLHVLLVTPGSIRTAISRNALTKSGDKFGRLDAMIANGLSADVCAEKILKALEKERFEVVIAKFKERLALTLSRWFPRLFRIILARVNTL